MSIQIFRAMDEYVRHIDEIEEHVVSTLVASSFLSSHLFSKSIVLRFFQTDSETSRTAHMIMDKLWERRKRSHMNMRSVQYKEIYELAAIEEFCKRGIIHRQVPNFAATPKEIIAVLRTMLSLLRNTPLYEIAFCREVLPFVFILKIGNSLTIDVRNNYGYQRIQGIFIDDKQIVAEFEKEFRRIWQENTTISNRDEVISFIEDQISFIENGSYLLSGL